MKNKLFGAVTCAKIAALVIATVLMVVLAGCSSSTILNGVWKNASGDEITLKSDNTFTAKIPSSGDATEYVGSYVVQENIIQFTCENGDVFLSQYSVDGGLLCLVWTPDDEVSVQVKLYRTKVAG